MSQKRYKLLIWFYLKNHTHHKTIHAVQDLEVELIKRTDITQWVGENDKSIAKAILIDQVRNTQETIIKRTIEVTIF
jgi:hypothetical protein